MRTNCIDRTRGFTLVEMLIVVSIISIIAAMSMAALMGAALALSACATVKGVGRDIESVGQAGSDAINN